MGHYKQIIIEQMQEMQKQKEKERLAELLGIANDEMKYINYNINPDENKDGFIYGYIVNLDIRNDDKQGKQILQKIERLDNDNQVYIFPWEWETDYEFAKEVECE